MSANVQTEFPRFRLDREEYENSQRVWQGIFEEALPPGERARWKNWLQDPFADGSPIFSQVNPATRKGVVINQILPTEDDLLFRAYLDEFASGSDDRVGNLVITCPLTDNSKIKARNLIHEYLREGVSLAEIERLCVAATD